MKNSRLRTLLIGLIAGVAYAFLALFIVTANHKNVSVAYIFALPIMMGAIPVLFSTKEQLQSYKTYLLLPWVIVITFFFLTYVKGFEGMICLVIIVAPFLLLGSLGAFIFRLAKLKNEGNGTKLYLSLLLPMIVLMLESNIEATDQLNTIKTSVEINTNKATVFIAKFGRILFLMILMK
jgi:hypothetical protein